MKTTNFAKQNFSALKLQTQNFKFNREEAIFNGSGDYTNEKYQQPDLTIEEIDVILKNMKQ